MAASPTVITGGGHIGGMMLGGECGTTLLAYISWQIPDMFLVAL